MSKRKYLSIVLIFTSFLCFILISCDRSSGPTAPTFDSITLADIQAVTLSTENIDGSDATNKIPAGTIVVYKTKNGRYGKFLVDTWGHDLVFNWVTYNLANDGTVYSFGSNVTIRGTWWADLDNGVEINGVTDSKDGDFFWEQFTGTKRAIVPENGAMFAVYP